MKLCLLLRVSASRVAGSRQQLLSKRGLQNLAFVAPRRQQQPIISRSTYSPHLPTTTIKTSIARHLSSSSSSSTENKDFFAEPSFDNIGIQSQVLLDRLERLSFTRPTVVQAAAFQQVSQGQEDVMIGAETGSGKTLAYLLPLIDDILQLKHNSENGLVTSYDYARAIILVPNKELVQQVLRMAIPLCGGSKNAIVWKGGSIELNFDEQEEEKDVDPRNVVRLAVMPGALEEPLDFKPFRDAIGLGGDQPPVDLIISTPASIAPLGLSIKHLDMFADIRTLVIDEADMLLDGGYIRPLENVLLGFRRADRLDPSLGVPKTKHIFCAATLPDMGLRSVDAYLQRKFPYAKQIKMAGMHNARHYGLAEPTVWIQEESKKGRLEKLVELLGTSPEEGGLKGQKVMVFLNSVDDVEGANLALERVGMKSVPYHAKVSLSERSENLDMFRRYNEDNPKVAANKEDAAAVPILVCTDLASRGLDVPGVNAVVQLQFAGNVVAHLHRMGRCGRAGQRTGRGIVFYNEQESNLVDVVREAETQQERMELQGDVDDLDEEGQEERTVKKAFSRKRGFTQKIKKIRREEREARYDSNESE
jgi:superfamily II DNA/RNA helicase